MTDDIDPRPSEGSVTTQQITITVHEIATDGLPDMYALAGRVAFLFDGKIVSGWPLWRDPEHGMLWEGNSDVAHNRPFGSVTHWVEFPEPLRTLENAASTGRTAP